MAAEGLVAAMLMRDAFRRESVAVVAARQAGASRADTEVVLDLAYRIFLSREPGGFSFGYDSQLDEVCPSVCDSHVREVLGSIRETEQRELVSYMCGSPAWRRYLTRSRAPAYLALVASFDARLDACVAENAGGEEWRMHDRHTLLTQREEAVLAWLREETIALMTDNALLMELS